MDVLNVPSEFTNSSALIIATGYLHTCMTKSGVAKCFGGNFNGQTDIPSDFTGGSATIIAAGNSHTCMSKSGLTKCFG